MRHAPAQPLARARERRRSRSSPRSTAPCLGGGLELALACHYRVATDDPKTVARPARGAARPPPGRNGTAAPRRARRPAGRARSTASPARTCARPRREARPRRRGRAARHPARGRRASWPSRCAESRAQGRPRDAPAKKAQGRQTRLTRARARGQPARPQRPLQQAREAAAQEDRGNYPAPERILDVLERFGRADGFEASKEAEAKAFGELVVSETAHRLMEIFFATTALKKDTGVDDPHGQAARGQEGRRARRRPDGRGIAYVTRGNARHPGAHQGHGRRRASAAASSTCATSSTSA